MINKHILYLLFFTLFFISCREKDERISISDLSPSENLLIRKLDKLPAYFPSKISSFQVDLRSRDLTDLNLETRKYDLEHSIFDNFTIWPDLKGTGFDPEKILNINLTPGMNIKKIHKKGITGKDVTVAVIDLPLSFQHNEYNRPVVFMDSFPHREEKENSLHGSYIVSSIIGKNIGIAPDANCLFYSVEDSMENGTVSCANENSAMKSILQYNRSHGDKISIVSNSSGANRNRIDYEEYLRLVDELEKTGVTVFSTDLMIRHPELAFYGMKKDPEDDPDDMGNYEPIPWEDWIVKIQNNPGLAENYSEIFEGYEDYQKVLLIPLDGSKTYAGYNDVNQYWFKFNNGWSAIPPVLSGLFALAGNVEPQIGISDFWACLWDSGIKYQFQSNGKILSGSIIRPVEMIESLQVRQMR